ncbi:MAG: 30S ribosomal protein S27e [Candidatus Altiarchaeia archaeon]|jgi:small subunit ribosomal protein S27e
MASKQQKTRSRFLKVKCNDCGNEQVIFGCASSPIKCIVCEKMLAVPTGGKTQVKTEILEVLDKNI